MGAGGGGRMGWGGVVCLSSSLKARSLGREETVLPLRRLGSL